MEAVESKPVSAKFSDTHTIVYNNKHIPINISIFNLFTDFLEKNQDQIQPDKTFILVNDGETELSEKSVQIFFDFCQFKEVTISNDDIFSLYYLSKKFKVQKMIDELNQHVFQQKDPIFQFFLYDQEDDPQKKNEYEDKITQNLNNIIDNDSLLSLPIPFLYRILSRATNIDQTKIENFLIKMLSKYGREASVLFDKNIIDMKNASFAFMAKLMNDYSDIIDPHYLNPVFMKSIHDQQTQIIKDTEVMKQQQEQIIEKLSEENQKMHVKIENLLNLIKRNISCTYFPYGGEKQEFNGIISYLTALCGGNVNDKGVVIVTQSSFYVENDHNAFNCKYAVDFGNKNIQNYFVTTDKPNGWLKYDFVDRKVRPTIYTIKSRPKGTCNNYHLKSWVIEGSNTGNDDVESDWKILDKREDNGCLVGCDFQSHFDIQTRLEPNESFRYLRLRLTNVDSGDHHYIILSALEYFGYLYHNF